MRSRNDVATVALATASLIALNYAIIGRMFGVEYSAHLGSNEGTFIALARHVVTNPGDLQWWPLWECGLPFQHTYLPLLPLVVGWFAGFSGHSPALSFHQVSATFYCIGPALLFLMCWGVTGKKGASFLAALAYSLLSPCGWLTPLIRTDLGSVWRLRRLQVLAFYGEAPLTASMAVLPLAIWALVSAVRNKRSWIWIGAGLAMAATILFNAFGAVILGIIGLSLLGAAPALQRWRTLKGLLVTGILTYSVISPLLPPSVIASIRMNSPTVDGDYRFTMRSFVGVIIVAVLFALVLMVIKRVQAEMVRFAALFTVLTTSIVLLGTIGRFYVVPQPHRYQLAMDMAWALLLVFGSAELLRLKRKLVIPIAVVLVIGLIYPLRKNIRWAHDLIRSVDITTTASYRVARWFEQHMPGQRVMVSGSYSFQFNDLTDSPQLLGGHDPMQLNFVMRIAGFLIYSGMNAGSRDAELSVLWLKALGARAITVPGPASSEIYKPFANPRKFEGYLPVLWREGDDTIYEVPSRSTSLAHVIPPDAAVQHQPIHGLDVAEMERYIKALEDNSYTEAPMTWPNWHTAQIRSTVQRGQLLSVQVTYHPGWRATANGQPVTITKDGLGMMLLHPSCDGSCEVQLVYGLDREGRATLAASLATMIGVPVFAVIAQRRVQRRRHP